MIMFFGYGIISAEHESRNFSAGSKDCPEMVLRDTGHKS